jgi:hypothetical protein
MLSITFDHSPHAITFRVQGRLISPWVREFEQCWRTAHAMLGGRRVVVDLAQVSFIDGDGKRMLALMAAAGAEFVATTPMTRAMVEAATRRKLPEPRAAVASTLASVFALLMLSVGLTAPRDFDLRPAWTITREDAERDHVMTVLMETGLVVDAQGTA